MGDSQITIAIEIAFQWQAPDRWSESYWLSNKHSEETQIGWGKSRSARSLEQSGYPREDVDRVEKSSIDAFRKASAAESTIDRRHNQLNELRGLLRQIAPELMTLVPVVNFWNDRPADLTLYVEQMIEIESKLRVKLSQYDDRHRISQEKTSPPATTIQGLIKELFDGDPDRDLPALPEFAQLCQSNGRSIKPPKDHGTYESAKTKVRQKLRETINSTVNS